MLSLQRGHLWLNLAGIIQLPHHKNLLRRKHLGDISHTCLVITHSVWNFVAMTKGVIRVNLNDAVKLAFARQPYHIQSKVTTLSCVEPELWQFKQIFNFPNSAVCIFSIFSNKSVKFLNKILSTAKGTSLRRTTSYTIQYDKSLTWTQKLSVISLIYRTKRKKATASALVQYWLKSVKAVRKK